MRNAGMTNRLMLSYMACMIPVPPLVLFQLKRAGVRDIWIYVPVVVVAYIFACVVLALSNRAYEAKQKNAKQPNERNKSGASPDCRNPN